MEKARSPNDIRSTAPSSAGPASTQLNVVIVSHDSSDRHCSQRNTLWHSSLWGILKCRVTWDCVWGHATYAVFVLNSLQAPSGPAVDCSVSPPSSWLAPAHHFRIRHMPLFARLKSTSALCPLRVCPVSPLEGQWQKSCLSLSLLNPMLKATVRNQSPPTLRSPVFLLAFLSWADSSLVEPDGYQWLQAHLLPTWQPWWKECPSYIRAIKRPGLISLAELGMTPQQQPFLGTGSC